jgi:hypothetical protein
MNNLKIQNFYEQIINLPDDSNMLRIFYKKYKNFDKIKKEIDENTINTIYNNNYYIYNKFNQVKHTSTGCWVWECPR